MLQSDDVQAMLKLSRLGWGKRRIAKELKISINTVRKYVRQAGWNPYQRPVRAKSLDGLESWITDSFHQHAGNADVVRQELRRVHGVIVSLRTVERAVQEERRLLEAEAKATVRFETPPGQQLQIDFGTKLVEIGGVKTRVYLFVATLGFSRRNFVAAFRHERQSAWMEGLERSFRHFGGVPEEVLSDNPKALVTSHDLENRTVTFHERFLAFARYWGFRPRACAPYRARTKGKDENGVGYAKKNALAGHVFASWDALESHLESWMREVADVRVHGTTGERPMERFDRQEAAVLRPLDGRPPFEQRRELQRKVHNDCCVEVDSNHYSVPWELIGNEVSVQVVNGEVRITHGGRSVASHPESRGHRQRIINHLHLQGIIRPEVCRTGPVTISEKNVRVGGSELQRSLFEYEQAIGRAWL